MLPTHEFKITSHKYYLSFILQLVKLLCTNNMYLYIHSILYWQFISNQELLHLQFSNISFKFSISSFELFFLPFQILFLILQFLLQFFLSFHMQLINFSSFLFLYFFPTLNILVTYFPPFALILHTYSLILSLIFYEQDMYYAKLHKNKTWN
jgi:hypothetical protein